MADAAVRAYIGLGSNMGCREDYLCSALNYLAHLPGVAITGISSIYETEPWGVTEQDKFLNMVVEVSVSPQLTPPELLRCLQEIENKLGRLRTRHWGPRTIDLDLLLYDEVEMDTPFLRLPHPQLTKRAFVLVPLMEVAPALWIKGIPLRDYLAELEKERAPGDVVQLQPAPILTAGGYCCSGE